MGAFVCVHVAVDNDVNPSIVHQTLQPSPHRFSLELVVLVGTVPGRMPDCHKPGRYSPVDLRQVLQKPRILRTPRPYGRILSCEGHEVHRSDVHAVPQRRSAAGGLRRRWVPGGVGDPLLCSFGKVMVSRAEEVKLVGHERLHRRRPCVPPPRCAIGIAEVAREEAEVCVLVDHALRGEDADVGLSHIGPNPEAEVGCGADLRRSPEAEYPCRFSAATVVVSC
mmetsp:Transcript_31114/g.73966  ORF Transcript_31114/g.73966 Transcript_31114/m.73966 type:complete len:223 (-) Transcript_31114:119-787(-)